MAEKQALCSSRSASYAIVQRFGGLRGALGVEAQPPGQETSVERADAGVPYAGSRRRRAGFSHAIVRRSSSLAPCSHRTSTKPTRPGAGRGRSCVQP